MSISFSKSSYLITAPSPKDSYKNLKVNNENMEKSYKSISNMQILNNLSLSYDNQAKSINKNEVLNKIKSKDRKSSIISKKPFFKRKIGRTISFLGLGQKIEHELYIEDLSKALKRKNKGQLEIDLISNYLKNNENIKNLIFPLTIVKNEVKLQNELLMKITKSLNLETGSRDEILFRYGDKPDRFYIILSGSVSVLSPFEEEVNISSIDMFYYFCLLSYYEEYGLIKRIYETYNKNNLINQIIYPVDIFIPEMIRKINKKNKSQLKIDIHNEKADEMNENKEKAIKEYIRYKSLNENKNKSMTSNIENHKITWNDDKNITKNKSNTKKQAMGIFKKPTLMSNFKINLSKNQNHDNKADQYKKHLSIRMMTGEVYKSLKKNKFLKMFKGYLLILIKKLISKSEINNYINRIHVNFKSNKRINIINDFPFVKEYAEEEIKHRFEIYQRYLNEKYMRNKRKSSLSIRLNTIFKVNSNFNLNERKSMATISNNNNNNNNFYENENSHRVNDYDFDYNNENTNGIFSNREIDKLILSSYELMINSLESNKILLQIRLMIYNKVKTININEKFGDIAFSYDNKRTGTIICNEDSIFAVMNKENYEKHLKEMNEKIIKSNITSLQASKAFNSISTTFMKKFNIISHFDMFSFNRNKFLYHSDQEIDFIYFIKKGSIELTLNKSLMNIDFILNSLQNNNPQFNDPSILIEDYPLDLNSNMSFNELYENFNILKKVFILENFEYIGLDDMSIKRKVIISNVDDLRYRLQICEWESLYVRLNDRDGSIIEMSFIDYILTYIFNDKKRKINKTVELINNVLSYIVKRDYYGNLYINITIYYNIDVSIFDIKVSSNSCDCFGIERKKFENLMRISSKVKSNVEEYVQVKKGIFKMKLIQIKENIVNYIRNFKLKSINKLNQTSNLQESNFENINRNSTENICKNKIKNNNLHKKSFALSIIPSKKNEFDYSLNDIVLNTIPTTTSKTNRLNDYNTIHFDNSKKSKLNHIDTLSYTSSNFNSTIEIKNKKKNFSQQTKDTNTIQSSVYNIKKNSHFHISNKEMIQKIKSSIHSLSSIQSKTVLNLKGEEGENVKTGDLNKKTIVKKKIKEMIKEKVFYLQKKGIRNLSDFDIRLIRKMKDYNVNVKFNI